MGCKGERHRLFLTSYLRRAGLTRSLLILLPAGSRYIYELYYEKEAISRPLYDWLLKNNCADANLIAKWKKQGYEKVCQLCCGPWV